MAGAEDMLDALARSGRSGRDLLVAFRTMSAFVMGFAQVELAGPLSVGPRESADAIIERVRSLPAERFPRLIEIAGAAADSSAEAEFHAALDLVVRALDSAE
jgi:hypothetical protein